MRALRLAAFYAAVGVSWILLTDWLVGDFPGFHLWETQTLKGLAYVAATAVFVYALIRVTGRKIERERVWYRELFENNPQPMWVFDRATLRFLAVNNAAVLHYGYSRAEFLGMSIAEIRPPEDLPALLRLIASEGRGFNRAGVWRHRRKDGTIIRVEISSHTVDFQGRDAEMVLAQDVTARLAAEEALQESEARFREMAENVQDVYYNFDPVNERLLYVSPSAARIIGRPLETIYANPMSYMYNVHPDDRAVVLEADRQQRLGEPTDAEFRLCRADGGISWIQDRSNSIIDEDGRVTRIVGVMRDITAMKVTEKALRENEERLRLVTRATSDLIWDVDAVSGTIWWGESFQAFFGHPRPKGSVTSVKFWEERVHPEDRERVFAHVDRAFERGGKMWSDEYRLRREDGSYVHVLDRGYVVRDDSGKAVRMIGGMSDQTARRAAEKELRRSEERFRLLSKATSDVIRDWNVLSDIMWWSEGFETFSGFVRADVEKGLDSWSRRIHPEDAERVMGDFRGAIESPGEDWAGEYRFARKDGSYAHVQDRVCMIRDKRGRCVRLIGGMTDVTPRVVLEEQYRQAQKMEAVGRLAGGIAHDFNNMLTVILVRSEMTARRLAPEDPLRETFKEIHDAASRSAGLTRQLLAYARRQPVSPKLLDLNESIGAMRQMLRRLIGEDIVLDWLPGEALWKVRMDPTQVDQILANLCVNARDAISDVGRVVIETRNVTLGREYFRSHPGHQPGDYVLVAVSDDGAGMDSETRARLFEPFFTTKEVGRGTGLGLPTVYGIVQQNNGFIHVYSEPGEGTTFRIYLPRALAEDTPRGLPENREPPRGRGETLLVVEDEPMILEVTVEILEGLGYTVLSTTSPEQALRIASGHEGAIDLLLTDVIMPGMNGRDLAARMRSIRPGLRVLLMSGYTANVITVRGLVDRDDAFVQKPFSTGEIAARVRSLLDEVQG